MDNATVGATSEIEFASLAQVGVSVEVTPKLVVEVDAVQMGWSVFDQLIITAENPAFTDTLPENYDDALSFRLGVEYDLSDKLVLRGDYVRDTAPGPDETLGPILPDADRNGISVGAGWEFMPCTTLDIGYLIMMFEDRSTNGKSLMGFNGTYKNTAHLFGINISKQL